MSVSIPNKSNKSAKEVLSYSSSFCFPALLSISDWPFDVTAPGNPLASVVGTYAIKVLVDEKLAENARIHGAYLMNHLHSIKNEFPDKIKEVRGKGLLTAFEMYNHNNLDGHKVSVELLNHGVYAKETHHSTVRLAPALTINNNQIDRLCNAIRSVIKGL